MKAVFSFLALFLAAAPGSAQRYEGKFPLRAGFSVQGGGSLFLGVKHDSYETFRQLYNESNHGALSRELGGLRPAASFSYGAGAHIGPLYFNLVQYRTTATAEAVLRGGAKREFRLEFRPLDLNFDLLFPVGRRVRTGMALGMELQKARLYSGYRYPNGYLSYAEDRPLNGIYDFWSNSLLNLGLRLDVDLLRRRGKSLLALSLRAEKMGAFSKFTEGTASKLLPLRDEMMVNVKGGGVFDDGELHNYLPEDPKNATNEYAYFIGQGCFNSVYKGWRISASLLFIPLEWKLTD